MTEFLCNHWWVVMLCKPCKGKPLRPSLILLSKATVLALNINHTGVASLIDSCRTLCRSSYKAAVKGVAYLASAFDSHWERMRPALRSAIEGELASRKSRLSHACHKPACLAANASIMPFTSSPGCACAVLGHLQGLPLAVSTFSAQACAGKLAH